MKRKLVLVAFLCIALLIAGCIPSQFTKGVKADEYPEKDLPVYDDAVIYEYEEDDDEVTIKYGTEDDIDDVTEFYQDYFDDEGIFLDDEEAEDDEYSAAGFYEDFEFEIKAEEADGKNEEKVFETTVEVNVKFLDDDEIEERQGGNLEKDIVGFWQGVSAIEDGIEESMEDFGFAMEFFADGTFDMYFFYMSEGMTGTDWSISDEGQLIYSDPTTGESITADISIEKDGKDTYLYMTVDGADIKFMKVDKDDFLEGSFDVDDWFADDDDDIEVPVPMINEQVLMNQDGIKVTAIGFESSYYSLDLKLLIENTTDKKVNVDMVSLIINGYTMQDAYIIGIVDPNAKLNTEIAIDTDELALCNIQEIVDIELILDVTDYDSWDTMIETDTINIKADSNYMQKYDSSGETVVDEQDVLIKYKELVIPDDGYSSPFVSFYVENNSNRAVDINCDSVQVNGFMVSGYIYGTVQPGSRAVLTLDFYSTDLEDNNIETFDSVKLQFVASYADEWTYFIETDIMELPIN